MKDVVGITSLDKKFDPKSIKIQPSFPSRFRLGDINSDGYPDLIGLFNLEQGTLPLLLLNQDCENAYEADKVEEIDES